MSGEGEYVDVALRFFAPPKVRIDKSALLVAVQKMVAGSELNAVIQATSALAVNARVLRDDFS